MSKKIINSAFCLVALAIIPFLLCSCSVYMAAKKTGVSVDEIAACKTRICLISKGALTVTQQKNKSDVLTEELFEVQKPSGSAARAAMHGVLDVATMGVWEVAGTPIEGTLNKPDRYAIRVSYEPNGTDIKSIQLVQ